MIKIKLIGNRIKNLKQKVSPYSTAVERTTGSALRKQRWNAWKRHPYCASCGVLVDWPNGFELDHIIPLEQGGKNIESNRQILCVWWDGNEKRGCHAEKTALEAVQRIE